jgi:hypothetical protein
VSHAGAEDEEHPSRGISKSPQVQTRLSKIVDDCVVSGIERALEEMGAHCDLRRLRELRNLSTDHTWLWALSPHHGRMLDDDEFVEAVRVRFGAGGPMEPVMCAACGKGMLDTTGAHASCCALGEATRGRNAVRDVIYEFSCAADTSTEREPRGLVHSQPELRPADVLSPAAIPGRLAALYVGVTSPERADAGVDCTEAMFLGKTQERTGIEAVLESQNIVYRPIIWSTFGRIHGAAIDALTCMAKRIARKHGHSQYRIVLTKMRQAIGVEIARRAARMSLACHPRGKAIDEMITQSSKSGVG